MIPEHGHFIAYNSGFAPEKRGYSNGFHNKTPEQEDDKETGEQETDGDRHDH